MSGGRLKPISLNHGLLNILSVNTLVVILISMRRI